MTPKPKRLRRRYRCILKRLALRVNHCAYVAGVEKGTEKGYDRGYYAGHYAGRSEGYVDGVADGRDYARTGIAENVNKPLEGP